MKIECVFNLENGKIKFWSSQKKEKRLGEKKEKREKRVGEKKNKKV